MPWAMKDSRAHAQPKSAVLPLQPEPGHLRIAVAVEVRVEAADSQYELAPVRAGEPQDVGETAREADLGVQQPRVVGELALDPDDAFLRRHPRHQRDLDADYGGLWTGQRHAGQPE